MQLMWLAIWADLINKIESFGCILDARIWSLLNLSGSQSGCLIMKQRYPFPVLVYKGSFLSPFFILVLYWNECPNQPMCSYFLGHGDWATRHLRISLHWCPFMSISFSICAIALTPARKIVAVGSNLTRPWQFFGAKFENDPSLWATLYFFQLFLFRLIMTFMTAMSPVTLIITRESGVAWKKFIFDRFLGGLWNRDKQRTPDFPQVAYQPQATVR